MTIKQIDSFKVLISLCGKDMTDFCLDFEKLGFEDPHSKKILTRLLSVACDKAGVELKNKMMIVEAMPHESGCLILMTLKKAEKKQRKYRVKNYSGILCYSFENSEFFISALSKLYSKNISITKCQAVLCDNKYYLIFANPFIPCRAKSVLVEYGRTIRFNKLLLSKITESGTILAEKNAITSIGKHFVFS